MAKFNRLAVLCCIRMVLTLTIKRKYIQVAPMIIKSWAKLYLPQFSLNKVVSQKMYSLESWFWWKARNPWFGRCCPRKSWPLSLQEGLPRPHYPFNLKHPHHYHQAFTFNNHYHQALLLTMEWSKALLAKKSPPGSEVIIGKMTNNSQTSALIILTMFTTCVSSQIHVWPRAELSRESNLQWIHNLQSADCAVESHYTVYIVHMQSSHIVLQVV